VEKEREKRGGKKKKGGGKAKRSENRCVVPSAKVHLTIPSQPMLGEEEREEKEEKTLIHMSFELSLLSNISCFFLFPAARKPTRTGRKKGEKKRRGKRKKRKESSIPLTHPSASNSKGPHAMRGRRGRGEKKGEG